MYNIYLRNDGRELESPGWTNNRSNPQLGVISCDDTTEFDTNRGYIQACSLVKDDVILLQNKEYKVFCTIQVNMMINLDAQFDLSNFDDEALEAKKKCPWDPTVIMEDI